MKEPIRIPDRWLQGRCLILERHHGLDPVAAIQQATQDWIEQGELAGEHKANTGEALEVVFRVTAVFDHPDFEKQVALDLAEVQYVTGVTVEEPQPEVTPTGSQGESRGEFAEALNQYRLKIHNIECHNQHFERCESAWCHPPAGQMYPEALHQGDRARLAGVVTGEQR